MEYIIDGYNVLKQMPEYTRQKLKKGRDGLIKYLGRKRPQGSPRNRTVVVFDGKGNDGEALLPKYLVAKYNIEIMFSSGESADDAIRKLVKSSSNPRDVYVVTNDRELRLSVKDYGARPVYVKDFIRRTDTGDKGRKPERKLTPSEQIEITEEMGKIWS